MTKRVLTFAAAFGVFAVALLAILQILDLVSFRKPPNRWPRFCRSSSSRRQPSVLMITLLRSGTRH